MVRVSLETSTLERPSSHSVDGRDVDGSIDYERDEGSDMRERAG